MVGECKKCGKTFKGEDNINNNLISCDICCYSFCKSHIDNHICNDYREKRKINN